MTGPRAHLKALLLLAAAIVASAPASAETPAGKPYDVEIEGVPQDAIRSRIEGQGQLWLLKDKPPPGIPALRRRAEEDVQRVVDVLDSEGYWSAKASVEIDETADPPTVHLKVEEGPLYHLGVLRFEPAPGATLPARPALSPQAVGLEPGGPARAEPIEAAGKAIIGLYRANAHPWARIADRRIVVDEGTATMSATWTVEPGAAAAFGRTAIEGLKSIEPGYVERRVTWKPGAPFDEKELEATRRALVDTGLFSVVELSEAPAPAPDGTVPVTIRLTERLQRSIGAGVAYSTQYGFGTSAYWEHRNLLGGGERLRAQATFAESQLAAALTFRRPDFLVPRQDLLASAELAQDSPRAYTARRGRVFAGIERRIGPELVPDGLTLGYGVAWELDKVTDAADGNGSFRLASLPLSLKRDATDDLLDPRRGNREALELTPFQGLGAPNPRFLVSRLSGSWYRPLDRGGDWVLALSGRLGSIAGADRRDVPADKRLYAGGGGSVRGYGYQMLGPLSGGDTPIGGRSSVELGAELRIRITDTIGIVPFLDAGNVQETALPRPAARLFLGAGIGLRYFTAVGPLRLDLATPIERRPVDSPVQVYISLGQAF